MFNFDGAVFKLLYDFGIDFSNVDISSLSAGECFMIALIFLFVLVFVLLIIRGLFYCLRELAGSCLK